MAPKAKQTTRGKRGPETLKEKKSDDVPATSAEDSGRDPDAADQAGGEPAVPTAEIKQKAAMGRNQAQQVMDICKRLQKQGKPEALAQYKACRTWSEKREFASRLLVDRSASFLTCTQKTTLDRAEQVTRSSGWVYLWDVARLNGMNYDPESEAQDKLLGKILAGCQTREPVDPQFQNCGFLQYKYSKEYEQQEKISKTDSLELAASAECAEASDFGDIEKRMTGHAKAIFAENQVSMSADTASKPKRARKAKAAENQWPSTPNEDDLKGMQTFVKNAILFIARLVLDHKRALAFLTSDECKKKVWWSEAVLVKAKESIETLEAMQIKMYEVEMWIAGMTKAEDVAVRVMQIANEEGEKIKPVIGAYGELQSLIL